MMTRFFSALRSVCAASVMAVAVASCTVGSSPSSSGLSGETPTASPAGEEVAWVYACSDGTRFTARFEPQTVRVFLSGRSLLLRQDSPSAPYTKEGGFAFHTQGPQGILTMPGLPDRTCTGAKGPGPWELARLAGVHFRAVGHGPEWFLEMGPETGVVFTSEASGGRLMFPWGRPEADGDKAVWNLRGHGEMLTVLVSKRECVDDNTHETFDGAVTVLIDGKTFQGCGKALSQ